MRGDGCILSRTNRGGKQKYEKTPHEITN
jgi:hypothetical protein